METLEKKGKGSALLPFLLFIVIYLGAGLYFQAQGVEMAFYQFPSVTAMFIALLLAFCQGKGTIDQKFTVFAKGAANENVLTMLMIYILAGAFSTVASAMGGVDATVNLGLSVIPVHFLAAGVFCDLRVHGHRHRHLHGHHQRHCSYRCGRGGKGRPEPSPVSGRLRGRRHVRRQPAL